MCLLADSDVSRKVRDESDFRYIKFFKILYYERTTGKFYSPFYSKEYNIGDNFAEITEMNFSYYRTIIEHKDSKYDINQGIHVLTEKSVPEWLINISSGHGTFKDLKLVVVEVQCRKEDFLGCNANADHFAFTEIHITPEELRRVSISE